MTIKIDDTQLSKMARKYKSKIDKSKYFNLEKKIGTQSMAIGSTRIETKQIVSTIESFFAVYSLMRSISSDFGPSDFSDSYGLFCGALYGDSLLESKTDDISSFPTVNVEYGGENETLMINNLLQQYVNIASRTTTKSLPKVTRGFFHSLAYSARQSIEKYPQSLQKLAEEEILIGNFKLKGIDFHNKKPQPEGGVSDELRQIEPVDFAKLDISFDDIGGNYEAKEAALRLITQIQEPEPSLFLGRKPPKGILLYGPPGTGKTMIAKAIARELRRPFYEVKIEDILDKWVGNSEKQLASLLSQDNCVIFFDEMDSLGGSKSNADTELSKRLVNIIATKMSGINSLNSQIYLGAVNNYHALDGKLTRAGRFNKKLYVGIPDRNEIKDIYEKQIANYEKRSVQPNTTQPIKIFSQVDLNIIADATYDLSQQLKNEGKLPIVGADTEAIIDLVAENVEQDIRKGSYRLPTTNDFLQVIEPYKGFKIDSWKFEYEKDILGAIHK